MGLSVLERTGAPNELGGAQRTIPEEMSIPGLIESKGDAWLWEPT